MRLSKNNADALFALLLLLLLLLADFDRTTRNALQIANAHTHTRIRTYIGTRIWHAYAINALRSVCGG